MIYLITDVPISLSKINKSKYKNIWLLKYNVITKLFYKILSVFRSHKNSLILYLDLGT